MTSIPVDEIRARAASIRINWVTLLVTVWTALPAALGWGLRMLWFLGQLLLAGFLVGWRTASRQASPTSTAARSS